MKLEREHVHRITLAGIGLLQGVLFWLTYRLWPEDPKAAAWFAALVSFVAVYGLILQFAWTGRQRLQLLLTAAAAALAFALVTFWVWRQLPGRGDPFEGDDFRQWTFQMAATVALYVLLPFVQIFQESGRARFPYADLYRHSWDNFS